MGLPPSPRRKEESEQRKQAILQAARAVFARQGYANTVVEDIAAQAGIGKGTLYLYFRSKEQIYLAAWLENARQMHADSREAMAAAEKWQDKLRAYVNVKLRAVEQQEDFFRIFMTEFRNICLLDKPLAAEFYHLVQESEAQLAQVFAAAAAKGEIRPVDPELAALTVSDVTRGLIERRLRRWGCRGGPADEEFTLDFLCRALDRN